MEMVNSHSIRRLSTASAPKIAKQCCPIVIVCNFKNALYSNGCFYRQFLTLFFVDTHIYTPASNLGYLASPRTIFHGCQIVHWDPLDGKRRCPQKDFGLGYVKLHGFYANP